MLFLDMRILNLETRRVLVTWEMVREWVRSRTHLPSPMDP